MSVVPGGKPGPRLCKRCGERGHFAKACPQLGPRCCACRTAAPMPGKQRCLECHRFQTEKRAARKGTPRRPCGRCGEMGHLSTTCDVEWRARRGLLMQEGTT